MKRISMMMFVCICCIALALSGAYADSITLSGKTVPAETYRVYAPVSGTAETVNVEAGQKVQAEDTLYTVKTTKIYAENDGTVAGIFGQPGEDAETVGSRYGAVLYLEETPGFTVNASTDGAYNTVSTKYVHTGETVWVLCRATNARNGKGIITGISGNSYEIRITEGTFIPGDSVDIYRDEAYSAAQKIGRGSVSRTAPVAVTGSGAIVRIAVKDGDEVHRGDLLMETLDGTYDGYVMNGTSVSAGQTGVVGSISVQAGDSVQKGSVAAVIYPLDKMRVEASVPEDYCNRIREGDPVTIELETGTNQSYTGTVVLISSIATESEEEVSYRIVAEFTPDEAVRFGMSALLTAGEEDEPEEKKADQEPEEAAEETTEETAGETEEGEESGKRKKPDGWSKPEGFDGGKPEWTGDGNRPEKSSGTPEKTEETTENTNADADAAAGESTGNADESTGNADGTGAE